MEKENKSVHALMAKSTTIERKMDSSLHGGRSNSVRRSQGSAKILTLTLVSVVAVGLQFGWAVQLSLLTPYVQTLGVEHAFSSFIWLCGPITGFVVQPIMGVWSDNCKLKFGRRRPFIFAGSILACIAVIIIGFSVDIGYILGDTHIDCRTYKGARPRAATVFVIGFWLLDLSNNTIQGPSRALLADISGSDKRYHANAIFCLWMALGNILGFSAGASGKLQKLFPFLATPACCEDCMKLKSAFLIHVVLMALCTAITLWFAKETPLPEIPLDLSGNTAPLLRRKSQKSSDFGGVVVQAEANNGVVNCTNGEEGSEKLSYLPGNGLGSVILNLLTSVRQLSPQMKNILIVMALCWTAWFPFFLFDTDWMGREIFHGSPSGGDQEMSAYRAGVKEGSFGLLLNSVVLAISSFFIDPLCRRMGSKYVWALSNFLIFLCMVAITIISFFSLHKGPIEMDQAYADNSWIKIVAVTVFAFLGFPLAITYSVPYSITAELTDHSGGGQGIAMGILNLAVVIPQIVVAIGTGPWDALFGGGNLPAFALSAMFALGGSLVAIFKLPRLTSSSNVSSIEHGFP